MANSKPEAAEGPPPADNPDDFSKENPYGITGENLEEWGYDLYPERKHDRPLNLTNFFFKFKARDNIEQYNCEKKVVDILKSDPLTRIMTSAMNKAGCRFDFRRHINCEYCEPAVTGGFDPIQNQIVVCYNTARNKGIIQSVLFHEMIHMYDYCTRELDFKNIDHLACTEIRAANLTYCNYLSSFYSNSIERRKLKEQHKGCVKRRALDSVLLVRPVSLEEGVAAVNRVFDRCYKDMEPIGRRIRRSHCQADLAYSEAFLLGYD